MSRYRPYEVVIAGRYTQSCGIVGTWHGANVFLLGSASCDAQIPAFEVEQTHVFTDELTMTLALYLSHYSVS